MLVCVCVCLCVFLMSSSRRLLINMFACSICVNNRIKKEKERQFYILLVIGLHVGEGETERN